MSIIQEALKKVQKDVERALPAQEQTGKEAACFERAELSAHGSPRTEKSPSVYAPYLLAVLFLLGAAAIYGLRYHAKGAPDGPPAEFADIAATPETAASAPAAVRVRPEPATKPGFLPAELIKGVASIPFGAVKRSGAEALVLNGIMYLDDGPRAIINNSIVTEGESVEGAVVKRINRKSVILSSGGSEFTIDLK